MVKGTLVIKYFKPNSYLKLLPLGSLLTPDPAGPTGPIFYWIRAQVCGSELAPLLAWCISYMAPQHLLDQLLDPRSACGFRLKYAWELFRFLPYSLFLGSGLKFYNLHQTLNTNINILKSFTDIYCISSARSGFVFFISFTSFFLTLICPHHILSGMSCQACCLVLGHGVATSHTTFNGVTIYGC